ncbi:12585_t:CDS:2, partial [Dentiscutata heterogama]
STCVEFSDEKIEHREDQDIISKTPKEQDTNTKEQVKETNTYLTSTEYPQKSLNQLTIKDHDGMSSMLDQKMFIDLDNPLKENKDINIILKLNKNQIIKNCLNSKTSKRFHDHSKDLKDLERSKPQKDHKRRLNALRKSKGIAKIIRNIKSTLKHSAQAMLEMVSSEIVLDKNTEVVSKVVFATKK